MPMTSSSRPVPRRGRAAGAGKPAQADAFFRQIVAGMRNGVLAITRAGTVALLNEEGYRIFGVVPHPDDLGKPVAEVLHIHPDVVRQRLSAFDLHMLPNRAETRLRPSGKVIGYTLAFVRDDENEVAGVAMFFKDLTRVEQRDERELLRDRLAAVGEMAAAIAHEVKNPLAGIEVMAGVLRPEISEAKGAQQLLGDNIKQGQNGHANVQERLDFVPPMRLPVEGTSGGGAGQ